MYLPSQAEYLRSARRKSHAENIRENTFLYTNRYRNELQYQSIIEAILFFEESWGLRDYAGELRVPRLDIRIGSIWELQLAVGD